ncbi:MAG TPA: hypothetical protein VI387_12700 [Candidatus Brocadiales bacterium]|nr:hypothetical protein [Candidatus Brocadiales bacterium]
MLNQVQHDKLHCLTAFAEVSNCVKFFAVSASLREKISRKAAKGAENVKSWSCTATSGMPFDKPPNL